MSSGRWWFLRVLGVRVALGRDFVPEDDVRGAPPVAIITHALWVRRFGADPGVVDRTLSLEQGSLLRVRVIGVLPPGFEMPLETADLLLPIQLRPLDPKAPFQTSLAVLGRLAPDVTPERAKLMLEPQVPEPGPAPRGFRYEWRVPLGFGAERVVTLRAGLSAIRYPTIEHGALFFEQLLARARAMLRRGISRGEQCGAATSAVGGDGSGDRGRRPAGRTQRAAAHRPLPIGDAAIL